MIGNTNNKEREARWAPVNNSKISQEIIVTYYPAKSWFLPFQKITSSTAKIRILMSDAGMKKPITDNND